MFKSIWLGFQQHSTVWRIMLVLGADFTPLTDRHLDLNIVEQTLHFVEQTLFQYKSFLLGRIMEYELSFCSQQ